MTSDLLPDGDFPLALRVLADAISGRVDEGIHWGPAHVVVDWDKLADAPLLDAQERAVVRCAQAIAALEIAQGCGPHTIVVYNAFVQALRPRPKRTS